MTKANVLKILPLSDLTKEDLARYMCGLGYCFLENISKRYYDECDGKFSELSMDIDWLDEPEAFDLFLGVSIAYNLDDNLLLDYYGLWVKRDYAETNFNLGWIEDYCFQWEKMSEKMKSLFKIGFWKKNEQTKERNREGIHCTFWA